MTFTCDVDGNPVPTISWTRDGSLVKNVNDNFTRISFSYGKKQLTITNVSRTDSGEYRCVAKNRVGNDTSNAASLDVQCKYRSCCMLSISFLVLGKAWLSNCVTVSFSCKHCKFQTERALELNNWGTFTLESTACRLNGNSSRFPCTTLYTGIYFNGHYGRQGRDITWSNGTLFCIRHRNHQCNRRCNQCAWFYFILLHVKCLQYDNETSNKKYERKVL